jgi:hypothetical protein
MSYCDPPPPPTHTHTHTRAHRLAAALLPTDDDTAHDDMTLAEARAILLAEIEADARGAAVERDARALEQKRYERALRWQRQLPLGLPRS